MNNRLFVQIREFCNASTKFHSYNLPKNTYIWFGLLWGIQIPIAVFLYVSYLEGGLQSIPDLWNSLPPLLRFFSYGYPILFGCIFGILGTIRKEKNNKIEELIEKLQLISITDPLSGLYNRRHLIKMFHNNCARASRKGSPISIIFLDIDHFKKINDQEGHQMGDEVIKAFAHLLQKNCRPYDTACRWGGEEFLLMLPDVNESRAEEIAERIREEAGRELTSLFSFTFTVSAGVAQYIQKSNLDSFIDQADQALYAAKASGRNRVVCWSSICTGFESS